MTFSEIRWTVGQPRPAEKRAAKRRQATVRRQVPGETDRATTVSVGENTDSMNIISKSMSWLLLVTLACVHSERSVDQGTGSGLGSESGASQLDGAEYGSSKTAVFDSIASRGAVLTLFNGRDDGRYSDTERGYGRPTQPLFAGESFVEGTPIYQSGGNERDGRDASFEELLHFVHDNAGDTRHGPHRSTTRAELEQQDPEGIALLRKYLAPRLNYEARIDRSFTGTFHLDFDEDETYTHKSRYLLNARLTGEQNSGLQGNGGDNTLRGNSGNNVLHGGEGEDIAVFAGPLADYEISRDGKTLVVSDSLSGRDGRDTLHAIETLQFGEEQIAVSEL